MFVDWEGLGDILEGGTRIARRIVRTQYGEVKASATPVTEEDFQ